MEKELINSMFLSEDYLRSLIESNKLIIRPLLDPCQVNGISIDFRLGTDFLVSIQGREAFINASYNNESVGSVDTFFQSTRRKFGETFLLHPNQTVLASSLEYIKLPPNLYATLSMRSSYSRLGLTISSSLQPGYCGCISLELTNTSKFAINLTVGACLFQASFAYTDRELNYFSKPRKYLCQVRPQVTLFKEDEDLKKLNSIWIEDNKNIT